MNPVYYSESCYSTYTGVDSQQPQPTDFGVEEDRSFHQYPYSPESRHPHVDYSLGSLPTRQTTLYNPLATLPVQETWNHRPTEHGSPITDRHHSTGTFSPRPQRAYLSCVDKAVQTIQSDPINEGNEVLQERPQANKRQPTLELAPQNPYKSSRHQTEFSGPNVIDFVVYGKEGIRLSDALEGNWKGFKGGDDRSLFGGNRNQTLFRLRFVGCSPWDSKISVVDFTAKRRPITREKLAIQVARNMQKFIVREKLNGHNGDHPRCGWGDVSLKNVFLTRMVRVSTASWQPEIFVERPSLGSQAASSTSSSTNPSRRYPERGTVGPYVTSRAKLQWKSSALSYDSYA